MPGFKEANSGFALTIQPTQGVYNEPNSNTDMIPISSPDNGSDPITADDPTENGALWNSPRQLIGRRGRAGATVMLRGPGGSAPPAAGAWGIGRILQAAGFTELRNATAITGTAQAGGTTSSIVLASSESAVDDFYKGMPIQHANIGAADTIRGTSLVRGYTGANKSAVLMETMGAAVAAGTYRIPPCLAYVLSIGGNIPLLSAKVWRHRKAYRYRDCALNAFALNIPVANDQNTDLPSIEFSMVGVPEQSSDELTPTIPQSFLTPVPAAKAGKFAFAGLKLGHQSLRLEFALETGAPPNQNFDAGQEAYEIMSGSRTQNLDLNEMLRATLDLDNLVDTQTPVATLSGWGSAPGQRFLAGVPNAYLDPLSPTGRNGFLGVSGTASPSDIDRSLALTCMW